MPWNTIRVGDALWDFGCFEGCRLAVEVLRWVGRYGRGPPRILPPIAPLSKEQYNALCQRSFIAETPSHFQLGRQRPMRSSQGLLRLALHSLVCFNSFPHTCLLSRNQRNVKSAKFLILSCRLVQHLLLLLAAGCWVSGLLLLLVFIVIAHWAAFQCWSVDYCKQVDVICGVKFWSQPLFVSSEFIRSSFVKSYSAMCGHVTGPCMMLLPPRDMLSCRDCWDSVCRDGWGKRRGLLMFGMYEQSIEFAWHFYIFG